MKCEVPNKKLSNSWSIMTGLKTFVLFLGGNMLMFSQFRKIAKGLLSAQLSLPLSEIEQMWCAFE